MQKRENSGKTQEKNQKKNILHYPQLDTILMIETFIRQNNGKFRKKKIWESLPKKMMYQTFCVAFDYLSQSGKISTEEDGRIIWNETPQLHPPTQSTNTTPATPTPKQQPPNTNPTITQQSPKSDNAQQYQSANIPKEMKEIIEKLHPLERKVLPVLFDGISLKGITSQSSLQEVEAMRALQWLENKKLLIINTEIKETITLDSNGEKCLKHGFPEKRFLLFLTTPKTLQEIRQSSGLSEQETNAAMGILKQMGAIKLDKKISVTELGKDFAKKLLPQEEFLRNLPLNTAKLSKEQEQTYLSLKQRKGIIKTSIVRDKIVQLTKDGKNLVSIASSTPLPETVGTITPEILRTGKWKENGFRAYDIKINVPKITGGKIHPYNDFLWQVRRKLVSMGFEEMDGPIIETEFFNFDALYQPQNHPARDWSDTYKIKSPKYGSLPEKKIVDAVKNSHETGKGSESTGWGYKWSETIASQLMPRAHDTAISPRYLAKGVKIPGKYFSIVRCYRPDVIDNTHGVEFNQLGGFVIGDSLDFRHLLGLLMQFASEITGAKEFRFRPSYYPFTEPSVELSAKHPKFGWLEIAGAGIFRPEMTEPLGYKQQVIAWGFGIDRLAMLKLGIKDIRELFTQDISYLRKAK
jgi:phenylalanyl-tRNA synthetase alpha chain